MKTYSVKELSKLAGISVRTLHHYDHIGLLRPAKRSDKGYRIYHQEQLLLLQQILFYREMAIPLKEITQIINDPDFDVLKSLEFHKKEIARQTKRWQQLLITIEKTISELKSNNKMMSGKELYRGFKPEEVKKIQQEVTRKWGKEKMDRAEERIRDKGSIGWKDHQENDDEINRLLASMAVFKPADVRVQKVILRHFKQMNLYYEVTKERYRGLGKLYVEDERFSQYYEKYRKGLAKFIQQAIDVFCDNDLKVIE